jgi:hypothetical protein
MTMTELLPQLFEDRTGYAADGAGIAGRERNVEIDIFVTR